MEVISVEEQSSMDAVQAIKNPSTFVRKYTEGRTTDVYEIMKGEEKLGSVVNRKNDKDDNGSWAIYYGKTKEMGGGSGPFVDGSPFDQKLGGIRGILNNKIATQLAMQRNRSAGR